MIKSPLRAIRSPLYRFLNNADGATSIEYALIASSVSIVIVGALATLGSDVKALYTSVTTALK